MHVLSCLCRSVFTPSSLNTNGANNGVNATALPQHAQEQVHDVFRYKKKQYQHRASPTKWLSQFHSCSCCCCCCSSHSQFAGRASRLPLLLYYFRWLPTIFLPLTFAHQNCEMPTYIPIQSASRIEFAMCDAAPAFRVYHHIRSNKLWIYFIRLCVPSLMMAIVVCKPLLLLFAFSPGSAALPLCRCLHRWSESRFCGRLMCFYEHIHSLCWFSITISNSERTPSTVPHTRTTHISGVH